MVASLQRIGRLVLEQVVVEVGSSLTLLQKVFPATLIAPNDDPRNLTTIVLPQPHQNNHTSSKNQSPL
jgi:hypothetical protein